MVWFYLYILVLPVYASIVAVDLVWVVNPFFWFVASFAFGPIYLKEYGDWLYLTEGRMEKLRECRFAPWFSYPRGELEEVQNANLEREKGANKGEQAATNDGVSTRLRLKESKLPRFQRNTRFRGVGLLVCYFWFCFGLCIAVQGYANIGEDNGSEESQ